MAYKKVLCVLMAVLFVGICASYVFAETPEDVSRSAVIENRLSQDKVKMEALPIEITMKQKVDQARPMPSLPESPVLIKTINVSGVTVLSRKDVDDITSDFVNREISGKEMQRCADLLTDAYALKGYITSYAYVDPSNINEGVLDIKAFEGKVGDVKIQGGHYFSDKVYAERVGLKEGDTFNFKKLKNNVFRTNRHPDRKVAPEVGTSDSLEATDVLITAKDKWPLHYAFDFDNYGSQFILQRRYKNYLTYNNLTGHDDTLTFKAQFCEADAQQLFDFDYYIPLNNDWKFQFYVMPYKNENYYDQDREEIDFEKDAFKWYFYFYQTLMSEPNEEFIMNYGFVYKDIWWSAAGNRQKWDRFRALLWGFDYVKSDDHGTTVVSNDLEIGIPRLWGGASAEDESCSVNGAGGKYKKDHLIVARRQKLPWEMDLLLKAHGQLANQALTGVNVFSVGGFMGVIDNRGYPRAQLPMDSGYSLTTGLSFPAYLIPKDAKVPFSKGNWYNALKLFVFCDYAKGYKKSPQSAMEKADNIASVAENKSADDRRKSLTSAGLGFTFTLPENFSMRLDIGWPVDHKLPMDDDHCHVWYRASKSF